MSGLARFWRGSSSESGQALVLIAITLMGMLMAVGLAIDSGQLFVARRTAQEAADAGAYAGAVYMYLIGEDPPSAATQAAAVTAATFDITRNGFTGDCTTGTTTKVCVTVGTYQSDPHYVEVTITTQVHTSLVPAQSGLTTVKVHAVAGAVSLNKGYAIMALDRGNTPNALQLSSNGHVNVSGAGILVNSTSPTAAYNQGGTVTVDPAPPYGTQVAGGVSGTWPNPTTGVAQQPDPFAGFAKPSTAGLPVVNALPGGNPLNLTPGIYTVPIQAAGGTTINLASGVYITKAGINGAGNADLISAAGGVFIFNTVTNYPTDTGGGCGSVNLTGNAHTELAPLATGPYKGLLFYQDPACTAAFTIAGNGTLTASGTIYLPTAAFVLNGSNATLNGSQLVAKTINAQNGTVNVTFSSGSTAQPILPRLAQ